VSKNKSKAKRNDKRNKALARKGYTVVPEGEGFAAFTPEGERIHFGTLKAEHYGWDFAHGHSLRPNWPVPKMINHAYLLGISGNNYE